MGTVKVFDKLRSIRAFEREHLKLLETIEDFDLVKEIGYHQETGLTLTLKILFLQNIGSAATIQRRLRRLKRLGIVHQRRSDGDKRNVELTIDQEIWSLYRKAGLVMKRCEGVQLKTVSQKSAAKFGGRR